MFSSRLLRSQCTKTDSRISGVAVPSIPQWRSHALAPSNNGKFHVGGAENISRPNSEALLLTSVIYNSAFVGYGLGGDMGISRH